MTGFANTIASALAVDRRQYRLLVSLFRELSARREMTGQLGLDRTALSYLGLWLVIIGGFVSLMAVVRPTARFFLGFNLAISALFLIPILVSDAADAFMNPAEAFVLAHQPIRSRTLIAAKATYIVYVAGRVVVSLNLIPAFAGLTLDGNRWFYPLTHLAAAALAGVFLALFTCGLFGVLFQFVPIRKLRNAALWMQLVAATMPFLLNPAIQGVSRLAGSNPQLRFDLDARYWSAVPLIWFIAVGLVGRVGRPELFLPIALPAMAISAVFIGVGARTLSQDYMTRIVMLMRARRANRRRLRIGDRLGAFARRVSGKPSGRAAFAFVGKMATRDWQFRRFFLAGTIPLLAPIVLGLQRGAIASPFAGDLAPAHFLPHLIGMVVLAVCRILVHSDQYRAAWVFLTVPIGSAGAFARGIYLAIWVPCIALPHLAVVAVFAWYWGTGEAVLFAAYSAAVASFYLAASLLRIEGLPFARAPVATAPFEMMTGILFLFVAGLFVALQFFVIFRHVLITVVATVVFAILAYVILRVSLRAVRNAVTREIEVISAGPRRIFKGIGEAEEL
jgi:hypothetical protein